MSDEMNIFYNPEPSAPGQMGTRHATLKNGKRVCKRVFYTDFGDVRTGEVTSRKLSFKTAPRSANGPGYDFQSDRVVNWFCEDDEIDKLLAFLNSEVARTGRYRVIDLEAPGAALLDVVSASGGEFRVDPRELAAVLERLGADNDLTSALLATGTGTTVAEAAVVERRRAKLADLRALVQNPATTESKIQPKVENEFWLFGGRYVDVLDRRKLTLLEQFDIPLVDASGHLHIVELKGPNIPDLVRDHRGKWIVGPDVHEAVGQAINYLRALDEQQWTIEGTFSRDLRIELDLSRCFATVVIGHPLHNKIDEVDEVAIEQTIRTYNAHLARVQVVTYKRLLDDAEQALNFAEHQASDAVLTEVQRDPPSTSVTVVDDPWVGG